MILSFKQMEEKMVQKAPKKLVLAGAHDRDVLEAVVHARRKGILLPVLIGKDEEICRLLTGMGEKEQDYEIIPCREEKQIADRAFEMIQNHQAGVAMKGLMQTSTFMRAVLNKEFGFVPPGGILSQATLLEYEGRMLLITDCAVNIQPAFEEKMKILKNAVKLAEKLGIECPKAAAVAPVEMVNPQIPATVDAAMLNVASRRGQLGHCVVDGPLALDNALSEEAARHKGIASEVSGHADILLVPDLGAGNILTKALVYFAQGIKSAGVLLGCTVPVVMTSRTDTPENKYLAILTALL